MSYEHIHNYKKQVKRKAMIKKLMPIIIIAIIYLLIPTVKTDPINGIIVDKETGEPIPEAYVIAIWNSRIGFIADNSHFNISEVKYTITDEKGAFHIPKYKEKNFSPIVWLEQPLLKIIKPGFKPKRYGFGSINYIITSYSGRTLITNESDYFGKRHLEIENWLMNVVGKRIQRSQKEEDVDFVEYLLRNKETIEAFSSGVIKLSKFHGTISEWDELYDMSDFFRKDELKKIKRSYIKKISDELNALKKNNYSNKN